MQSSLRKVKQYLEILKEYRYFGEQNIENISICPGDYKEGNTPPAAETFVPFDPGSDWGSGYDSHAWFHFTVDAPEVSDGTFMLFVDTKCEKAHGIRSSSLRWDAVNPQFIIYVNGEARQGMDINHTYLPLSGADKYDIYLYAYTGPRTEKSKLLAFTAFLRDEVDALIYDLEVPLATLEFFNPKSREYAVTLDYLDRAVSMLDLYSAGSEEFFASVRAAREFMAEEFYGKYCEEQPATTVCVGHTHIDCAWLWTLAQTREKVQRSFATVLELMRRYPEYKFMSSQALLYKYLKEESPEIYEGVKKMIEARRWECEGAMWVEADCNLSSGESLVRQVMYGKRFFKEEFGVENRVLWLPDVFGYSAALPQILRKSGVDWFVTSKISWNDMNVMPYETFRWQGIDGTEINSYFLTATDIGGSGKSTYNGNTKPKMISGTYWRYGQKALSNEAMLTYGFGDGGGGPTPEYIEGIRRQAKGIPGVPNAKIDFAGDFLSRLEEKIENAKKLPKWQGELYLEYHRGTYTSMAKNKKNNRQSEFLLADAEQASVAAGVLLGRAFPKAELHEAWETVLTNQFHDIIPGSSIKEVYDQCDIDYAEVRRIGENAVNSAREDIARSISADRGYVVFNPHSFVGRGMVKINGKSAYVENIPPKGYACVKDPSFDCDVLIDGNTVGTPALKVRFDEAWQIVSVYDKRAERELIKAGGIGNEIRIYPDYPDKYDNWEWQEYSLDEYRTLTDVQSVETVDDGARRGIRIERAYMSSKIVQTVWFSDKTAKIDFETYADWHEEHKMLKAAFDVDINSDRATYEIQFGTVERPTHKNTSWDRAKFEVCAHKYADLSDSGYGAALLNDCKYGYDIHDGVMQISMFKCGTYPNEDADKGEHRFTYSLMPHEGRIEESGAPREAYYLNYPMAALPASGECDKLPESFSLISLSRENVICETVKEAEDGDSIIVRLYETHNIKGKVKVDFGFDAKRVFVCDLLENEISELDVKDNGVLFDIGGYEIVTLKVEK